MLDKVLLIYRYPQTVKKVLKYMGISKFQLQKLRINLWMQVIPILLIHAFISAQELGSIENWETDALHEIATGTKAPIAIGRISYSGKVFLQLDESVILNIEKEAADISKEFNESHASGLNMSTNTMASVFPHCKDSILNDLKDQRIEPLGRRGNYIVMDSKTEKATGLIRFVSSPEFGTAYFDNYYDDLMPGYHLEWYYVEEPVSIIGSCAGPGYEYEPNKYEPTKNVYDLNFLPGWNLVVIEVATIITDINGKTYPLEMRYKTVEEVPSDIYAQVRIR